MLTEIQIQILTKLSKGPKTERSILKAVPAMELENLINIGYIRRFRGPRSWTVEVIGNVDFILQYEQKSKERLKANGFIASLFHKPLIKGEESGKLCKPNE